MPKNKKDVVYLKDFLQRLWEEEKIGPRTLTPKQAAEYLGVGVHTVRKLIKEGYLLTVPNLPGMRVAVAELDRFISLGVKRDHYDYISPVETHGGHLKISASPYAHLYQKEKDA